LYGTASAIIARAGLCSPRSTSAIFTTYSQLKVPLYEVQLFYLFSFVCFFCTIWTRGVLPLCCAGAGIVSSGNDGAKKKHSITVLHRIKLMIITSYL
jgi:hypothetical protein